jgi:hypothetical protein
VSLLRCRAVDQCIPPAINRNITKITPALSGKGRMPELAAISFTFLRFDQS